MGRPGSVYFVPDSYKYPPPGDKEYSAGIKITSTRHTVSKLFGALLRQLLELLWSERRPGPLRRPGGPLLLLMSRSQDLPLPRVKGISGRSGSWSRS